MLPPQNTRVPQLSKETGIPKDTLYVWRHSSIAARSDPENVKKACTSNGEISRGSSRSPSSADCQVSLAPPG
jgi:hypothetical protein